MSRALTLAPQSGAALPLAGLALAVLAAALAGLALGPVPLTLGQVLKGLAGQGSEAEAAILQGIRLPRIVLGLATGAALGGAGAALQGLLRNPLADPGLIGVTAGASAGAVAVIVLGAGTSVWAVPGAAFLGASAVILAVLALSRRGGEMPVATLILAGVAMQAIAFAMVGVLVFLSDDRQLRDFTFWSLGGLGGAGWPLVLVAAGATVLAAPLLLGHARALDLLQLGERAAFHAGVPVERVKWRIAFATALAVGAVTAAAGPISFIGLVSPHLVRLALGPGHRLLIPAAMLGGALLVLLADIAVRLAVPPAEPPIGLATGLIGGPFFLWLILRGLRRGHA